MSFRGYRVGENPAGIANEGVNSGLIYAGVFAIKLALDCPVFAKVGSRHKVNAQIVVAELVFCGKVLPKPDIGKIIGIDGISQKPRPDEGFKPVPFFLLGQSGGADVFQNFGDVHGIFSGISRRKEYAMKGGK